MRRAHSILLLIALVSLVLGGCGISSEQKIKDGYRYTAAGDTQMWRASSSTFIVEQCVEEEGITQETVVRTGFWQEEKHVCHGRYVRVDTPVNSQTGIAGSFIAPVVSAGFIGAGIGAGLAHSGSDISQSGGGATANSRASASSRSRSSSQQWQGQVQGQAQGQSQRQIMPMMGGMD